MVAQRATQRPLGGSALLRGLELLETLDTEEARLAGGLGVTRIAALLGREKSQVSRALAALAGAGYVEREPGTRRYRIGWRIAAMGGRAREALLAAAAALVLGRLVAEVGETAHVTVLRGGEVLTVASESPARALEAAGWIGRTVPVWCTASGRALLVDEDDAAVRLRVGGTRAAAGPNAPRSPAELLARLRADRRRGFAVADEELEAGLLGVAAPVRDASGRVVAAVNVSGPKYRLEPGLAAAGAAVVAAAATLGGRLSGVAPA
jgi:DNA-binding IclR family transcriptional regulator